MSLLEVINATREKIIVNQYNKAFFDLIEKITFEPLQTKFYIYSGCSSKQIADELAIRFSRDGVKTVVRRTGILDYQYYLDMEINLPSNLIHNTNYEDDGEDNSEDNSEDDNEDDGEDNGEDDSEDDGEDNVEDDSEDDSEDETLNLDRK